MQIVAADVGNSSIKYRVTSLDGKETHAPVQSINLRGDEEAFDFSPLDSIPQNARWFVSSVSPENEQRIRSQAESRGAIQSWTVLKRENLPLQIQIDQPETVGIDRLFAALAAHHQYGLAVQPTADVIVIDCGTALTIDLIDGQTNFRGGVIMAGPATNLLALSNMTAALPDLSREKLVQPPSVLGQSTREAMLSGAWHSGWGAIQQVVNEISQTTERPPVIVGTGGGLGPWQSVLPEDWIQVEDLVLDGILIAAEQSIAELP